MQTYILAPLKVSESPNRAIAKKAVPTNGIQPDLLYMDSVLVSTGENDNDDTFLADEMWVARKSPILKPVDWEHNTGTEILDVASDKLRHVVADNQIIGVMYNSYVALKDGTIIFDDMAHASNFEVPREFDIINQAVIYKYCFPKTAAMIVRDANAGRLFVSMEAWFKDYDYKVDNKIVARNEETSFLDRHLRANGGEGRFGDAKVGRVLRKIVFGGIGIVANPANKDSVIHSFTNANYSENVEITNSAIASNIIGKIEGAVASIESQEVIEIMSEQKTDVAPASTVSSEDYRNVVDRLVRAEHTIEQNDAALASAKAQVDELQTSIDSLASTFVEGAEALASVLGAEAADKLAKSDAATFFSTLSELLFENAEVTSKLAEQLTEATAKVAELELEKRNAVRSSKIHEALAEFIKDEEALASRKEKLAEQTKTLDDEAFASQLEDTKELLSLAASSVVVAEKKMDEEEEMDKTESKDDESAEASVDEGVTDPAILDSVRATASAPAGAEVVRDTGEQRWASLATELLSASKDSK